MAGKNPPAILWRGASAAVYGNEMNAPRAAYIWRAYNSIWRGRRAGACGVEEKNIKSGGRPKQAARPSASPALPALWRH